MALLKIDMQANGSAKDFVKYSKQILLSVTIVLVSLFEQLMRCFPRFGTICTIWKTWKTPMEEYYF